MTEAKWQSCADPDEMLALPVTASCGCSQSPAAVASGTRSRTSGAEPLCTVELGIDSGVGNIKTLEALPTSRPVIPCSLSTRWVKPELFGMVHFCGWRPGGWWRDASFAGWVE